MACRGLWHGGSRAGTERVCRGGGDAVQRTHYAAASLLPAVHTQKVLVRTPARSYTVQQLPELLAAIGDEQAVSFYDQVHRLNGRLSTGPRLANITMWSIYGRNVSTPKTWTFPSNIQAGKRAANGSVSVWGGGDGTVNLESLRLCNRCTRVHVCARACAWIGTGT